MQLIYPVVSDYSREQYDVYVYDCIPYNFCILISTFLRIQGSLSPAMTRNLQTLKFRRGCRNLWSIFQPGVGRQKLSSHVLFDFYFHKDTTNSRYLAVSKMSRLKLHSTFFFFQLFLFLWLGVNAAPTFQNSSVFGFLLLVLLSLAGCLQIYLLRFYCIFIEIWRDVGTIPKRPRGRPVRTAEVFS